MIIMGIIIMIIISMIIFIYKLLCHSIIDSFFSIPLWNIIW